MVDFAAAVPGCAWPVDAGACTPKGDRGSATSPFRRGREAKPVTSRQARQGAAGCGEPGAGLVKSPIWSEIEHDGGAGAGAADQRAAGGRWLDRIRVVLEAAGDE